MSTYAKMMAMSLAAGLLGAVACRYTEYNPGHCANEEGDATCERSGDGSRRYCRRGTDECIVPGSENGCVAERPDDACYSPCGGRSTIDENGECVTAEESTSSTTGESTTTTSASDSGTSSTSEPPTPCVGPEDCPDLDFYGYVWVVDQGTSAFRIDPATEAIDTFSGLVGPYTYSDMTG